MYHDENVLYMFVMYVQAVNGCGFYRCGEDVDVSWAASNP